MAGITSGTFDRPDETRKPGRMTIEVVRLGDHSAARITWQPGWRWSEDVKPVVHTQSCQARHVGTIVSGHLHVVHEDGTTVEAGPGGVYVIEPGHDAWVVGDEPAVGFEFESAATFAKA